MTLEEKRDATRIEHMHDAIARIAVLMGTLEKEDFLADEMRCEALAHRLTLLGEAANKISRAFKAAHPEIDWRRTVEFRNDIVHDYSEISYEEMWQRAETPEGFQIRAACKDKTVFLAAIECEKAA